MATTFVTRVRSTSQFEPTKWQVELSSGSVVADGLSSEIEAERLSEEINRTLGPLRTFQAIADALSKHRKRT